MADTDSTQNAQPQEVSDAELASAWDEVLGSEGEEVKEEPAAATEDQPRSEEAAAPEPEEALAEEPTDQRERSRLGRRLSQVEKQNQDVMNQLNVIAGMLRGGQPAPTQQAQQYRGPEAPEFVTTLPDLRQGLAYLQHEQAAQRQAYQQAYLETLAPFKTQDGEEDFSAAFKLMLSDPRYDASTGNPRLDADRNYHKALTAVLRGKLGDKVPLKQEQAKGTAPNVGTQVAAKTAKPVKLDEHARSLAKDMGLSQDELAEILGG